MGITSESSEPLVHRLEELERSISRLELLGLGYPKDVTTERIESEPVRTALPPTPINGEGINHTFGSVAIAVLGLAGGYVLRAVVQTGWLPRSSGIISAFLYALMWIVAGGFTKRGEAASAIYALASSIIFVGAVSLTTYYYTVASEGADGFDDGVKSSVRQFTTSGQAQQAAR